MDQTIGISHEAIQAAGRFGPSIASIRIRCCSVLLLTLCFGQLSLMAQARQSESRTSLKSVSDLIAVSDKNFGLAVFIADAEAGAVFVLRLVDSQTRRVSFDQFEKFAAWNEIPHPAALGFRDGKLIVCDASQRSLFEIDVQTRQPKLIWKDAPLQSPTSVSVSGSGQFAVADALAESITWLQAGREPKVDRWQFIQKPGRIVFDDHENLFILDRAAGNIFSVNGKKSSEPKTRVDLPVLPPAVRKNFTEINDFAFHRGIYYLATNRSVLAYARGTGTLLPVVFENSDQLIPTSLAVVEDRLIVADKQKRSVSIVDRRVPASISSEGDAQKFNDALVYLYNHLASQNALPTRELLLPRPYEYLEQLLVQEKTLVDTQSNSKSFHSKLTRVVCKINGWACPDNQLGTKQLDLVILSNLTQGRKVVIPDVSIKNELKIKAVSLAGKTVKQLLAERVAPEHLSKIDASYLASINVGLWDSLDATLARSRFVPASSPQMNLQPGTIITFENGREKIMGDITTCGLKTGERILQQRFNLPSSITSRDVDGSLPHLFNTQKFETVRKRDIERVELAFDRASMERLPQDPIEPPNIDCLLRFGGPDSYLIVEAVKLQGTRYTLRRTDGSVVFFDERDLKRFGIAGQSDPEKKWSLTAEGPFYVGYKIVRLQDIDAMRTRQPSATEVRSTQSSDWAWSHDIFSESIGVLNLPITQWRLSLLVSAAELSNKQSALHKVEEIFSEVYLLSEEEFRTSPSAYGLFVAAADDNPVLQPIREDRERLKKHIHYVPSVPGISEIVIGIGESEASVSRNHPDFWDGDGRSAWYQEQGCCGLEPIAEGASGAGISSPPLKAFSKDNDHGSHVAGLLAARKNSVAPGLLPTVGLFLIDTSSPAGLQQSIENARVRGIYIFNFSFTIPGDDALSSLKTQMQRYWYDRLFVVAAGNNGKDLRTLGREQIPISWADQIKNIVGVGAADNNHNALGEWQPDPAKPDTAPGTNISKQYVHLLAPGFQVYSTASNNSYAVATGSSQAVPQVTAAATMLLAQHITNPLVIKARLIYTADWLSPNFDGKVWGGELNYGRAVWEPHTNLLITQSDRSVTNAIVVYGNPTIKIRGGEIDDPRDEDVVRPPEIAFADILRIKWTEGGRYRIHYLDTWSRLRVLKGVESLEGNLRCAEYKAWDGQAFIAKNCGDGVNVSHIFDYIAKVPKSVRF